MKFLVTWKVFESITQEETRSIRGRLGQELHQMFDSPKIKDVGWFGDARGTYMILDDVNSADELLGIIGSEIVDNGTSKRIRSCPQSSKASSSGSGPSKADSPGSLAYL